MTTLTDVGLEAIADIILGLTSTRIDTLAVGTATGTETTGATALGNEIFRANVSDTNISLVDSGPGGQTEASIVVKGGLDIPAGSQITEVGVIENGAGGGGNNRLVFIDNVPAVTVNNGDSEQFTVPIQLKRGSN
jgi:hypothetical protein